MRILFFIAPRRKKLSFGERFFTKMGGSATPFLAPSFLSAYVKKYSKKNFEIKFIDARNADIGIGDCLKEIEKFDPDFIGISSFTCGIKDAYIFASKIKKISDIPILMGGPHTTFMPKEALQYCDIVVRGEGEKTFRQLIEAFPWSNKKLKKINGISYKSNKKIVHNPPQKFIEPLDKIPFPDWDICPKSYPIHKGFGYVLTSRGCPFRCTFCVSSKTLGKPWRAYSSTRVLAELEWLVEKYSAKQILFLDENFCLNKKRVMEICKGIVDRKLDIVFACDARVNAVDEEMLMAMKKAGCQTIYFGVESGYQKILDLYKKGITISQIKRAFRLCNKVGIPTAAGWIIHPSYNEKDFLHDLMFAFKLNAGAITLSQLIPFPGTGIYNELKNNKKPISQDWDLYGGSDVLVNGTLSKRKRKFWQLFFMLVYHLSPFAAIQRPRIFLEIWKTVFKMI